MTILKAHSCLGNRYAGHIQFKLEKEKNDSNKTIRRKQAAFIQTANIQIPCMICLSQYVQWNKKSVHILEIKLKLYTHLPETS